MLFFVLLFFVLLFCVLTVFGFVEEKGLLCVLGFLITATPLSVRVASGVGVPETAGNAAGEFDPRAHFAIAAGLANLPPLHCFPLAASHEYR